MTDKSIVIGAVESPGGKPVPARPRPPELPDADDLPFLEVAAQAEATLVSGKTARCPASARGPVSVLTPAEFINRGW